MNEETKEQTENAAKKSENNITAAVVIAPLVAAAASIGNFTVIISGVTVASTLGFTAITLGIVALPINLGQGSTDHITRYQYRGLNGNNKDNPNLQHLYEIYKMPGSETQKYGITGNNDKPQN